MESTGKEYIKSINFFDKDNTEVNAREAHEIYECKIQTTLNTFIFRVPDVTCSNMDCYLLSENFQEIDDKIFIGAEILRISDNVDELKLDENFATNFVLNAYHKWVLKYVKFTTSKGNFYVVVTFFDPNKSVKDVEIYCE